MPSIVIYIFRRIGHGLLVLVGLSILIFIIVRLLPGDPARLSLGQVATQEAIDRATEEMHLNDPIYIQYVFWIRGVFRGDLGKSLFTRRDVLEDIRKTFPATLELTFWAVIFSIVIGQILGILAARYHHTWVDNITRIIAYIGIVMPNYILAILMLLFLSMTLGIFPGVGRLTPGMTPPSSITGIYTFDALITLRFDVFLDALWHVALPAIAAGWASLSQESRITRTNMITNMNSDYITSDRGFGFPQRIIYLKYLLKPSIVPTISIMGPDLAAIMVNGFLVEHIFNWPGFSRYALQTVLHKDLNAVIAVVLIFGAIFTIVNLTTDLIIGIIDPRMRFRRGV